jgi:hypothetical protein
VTTISPEHVWETIGEVQSARFSETITTTADRPVAPDVREVIGRQLRLWLRLSAQLSVIQEFEVPVFDVESNEAALLAEG